MLRLCAVVVIGFAGIVVGTLTDDNDDLRGADESAVLIITPALQADLDELLADYVDGIEYDVDPDWEHGDQSNRGEDDDEDETVS